MYWESWEGLYVSALAFLNTCKTMYEKMREPSAPKKVNYVEFLIGNQPGLRGLNIFDGFKYNKTADLSNLRKYEGYIENDNGKIYIEFKGLKVKCLDRNALDDASKIKKAEQGQILKCSYHIAIRRLDSLAYKFERLENEWTFHFNKILFYNDFFLF